MRRPGQREARDVERQTRGTRWPRGRAPWVRASASGACGSGALGDKTGSLLGPSLCGVTIRCDPRVQGFGGHHQSPFTVWQPGLALSYRVSGLGKKEGRGSSFSSPREPGLATLTSRNSIGSCQRMYAVSLPNIRTRRLARPFPTARDPRRRRARVKDSLFLPLLPGRRVVPPRAWPSRPVSSSTDRIAD